MTPEQQLIKEIQVLATDHGARLFRVNTGTGWTGKSYRRQDGSLVMPNPRPLHAGLTKGGSDLIGWSSEGLFVAIEVKTGRQRPTKEQCAFLSAVQTAGGLAGVARSTYDAQQILNGGHDGQTD